MGKILSLLPAVVSKPWAGGHLENFATNEISQIGEVVLYSTLDQFPVRIQEESAEFLASEYSIKLPFMIKLLSTKEPLSIQNHPADEDIEKLGLRGSGKTECWFILEAEENAKIYLGLKEGIDPEILQELQSQKEPLSVFNCFSPRKGDIFFLPAGMVHGTEGRILFYEIQQNSDYTFRIYDFNRGRPLHIKEARQVFRSHKPLILHDQKYFACKHFRFWVSFLKKGETFSHTPPTYELLTWAGKDARLFVDGKDKKIDFGSSFITREGISYQLEANSEGYVIRAAH